MKVERLIDIIGADFYTGVPDSQLKPLCNFLIKKYGVNNEHHIIAANEGNSTALAAGYYLATGAPAVVYMQNSGEGNIINPVASLLNDEVYAIPAIFIIGWRGQPDIHDEPQHKYQGKVTLKLLEDMDIKSFVIEQNTIDEEVEKQMVEFKEYLKKGKSVAFVIKKGALSYDERVNYQNDNNITREEIINHIVKVSGEDPVISTTGKTSRELFEIREAKNQGHRYDFLTVGSMGHSSSIALGVGIKKKNTKVWIIDGDGAAIMHMGAMAIIGSKKPGNIVHIVINNGAHESVGGMPTVAENLDLAKIAEACGYTNVACVKSLKELDETLLKAKNNDELSFIEVKCAIGARADLGRPTTTTIENKNSFMGYLKTLD